MSMENEFIPYQLINSSPEWVFRWFQENASKKLDWLDRDRVVELEQSLLKRDEKLINLGLALYGKVPEIVHYLFENGDETIKKACCAGTSVAEILGDSWVEKKGAIPAMLKDWNTDLLVQLVTNPCVPDGLLIKLFTKEQPFDQLDEDKWILLLAWSSRNDRISKPYESDWIDGYDEYSYNKVFFSAWEAFAKVTPTGRNASAMSMLGERLVGERPIKTNVMEIINRWRSKDEEEDQKLGYVRTELTKILDRDQFKELKNSDDLALRKGYYSHREYCSAQQVVEDFERDGKDFLDSAISNKTIFIHPEVRSAFRKCSWNAPDEHSRLDYPNYFNMREKYWRSKHPEWFKDIYDGDIPFEEIDDLETRIDRRLDIMKSQLNELTRVVVGDRENEDDVQLGFRDTLYSETRSIAELLLKIYRQNTAVWGWAVAGLAIGYIAARTI